MCPSGSVLQPGPVLHSRLPGVRGGAGLLGVCQAERGVRQETARGRPFRCQNRAGAPGNLLMCLRPWCFRGGRAGQTYGPTQSLPKAGVLTQAATTGFCVEARQQHDPIAFQQGYDKGWTHGLWRKEQFPRQKATCLQHPVLSVKCPSSTPDQSVRPSMVSLQKRAGAPQHSAPRATLEPAVLAGGPQAHMCRSTR